MTVIEHTIEVDVPVSSAFVRGPELAELASEITRAAPEPPGPMHLELAFEDDGDGGLVPRLELVWGRTSHERGRVTFSSSPEGGGRTRVAVSLAWPASAGDDVGALYARCMVARALERYARHLETALEPLAAAAT
jgi:hypothetical protein